MISSGNIRTILLSKRDQQEEASRESPRPTSQQRLDFALHSTKGNPPTRANGATNRPQSHPTRRSSRSAVVEQRADHEMMAEQAARRPQNPEKILCRWPPTGRQELAITAADYFRLYGDEFLNDTLIDFGLRYVVEDQLGKKAKPETPNETPAHLLDGLRPEDVHVFNPFFYKKLATKVKINRPANSASDEPYPEWPAYESVRKWTNKVDVFQKKFLVIPVNENLHWYMAVIYNPGVVLEDPRFLRGSTPTPEPVRPTTRRAGREEEEQNVSMVQDSIAETRDTVVTQAESHNAQTEATADMELFEKDPMTDFSSQELAPDSQMLDLAAPSAQIQTGSDITAIEVMDNSISEAAAPTFTAAPVSQKPLEVEEAGEAMAVDSVEEAISPTETTRSEIDLDHRGLIMTFDSLSASHGAVSNVLNRWLAYEARDKKDGIELSWRSRQKPLPYKSVVVPSQRNFSDCGVYCLHNIEVLLSQPQEMMTFIYKSTLRKEQLNGEKLDHMTQWQGDVALEGRAKWRSIIDSLSDEPIGESEPAAGPVPDGLMEASQASSVVMISANEAISETSGPVLPQRPGKVDPRHPNAFLLAIQTRDLQQAASVPSVTSERSEVANTTAGPEATQRIPEEMPASTVSSTVAVDGSSVTGMVNRRMEDIELEDQGDSKTDEMGDELDYGMDDRMSNTAEIGPSVPRSAPDGQLRLPDTEGFENSLSEEEEVLIVQPDEKDKARMRAQGSIKRAKLRENQTIESTPLDQSRTRSSYDHRALRSSGRAATTAQPRKDISAMSPMVQELMMQTRPEGPILHQSPVTGSKRKPESGATSPQSPSRPGPKKRRPKHRAAGTHQDQAIDVED
jgi:Ulp1 family protease